MQNSSVFGQQSEAQQARTQCMLRLLREQKSIGTINSTPGPYSPATPHRALLQPQLHAYSCCQTEPRKGKQSCHPCASGPICQMMLCCCGSCRQLPAPEHRAVTLWHRIHTPSSRTIRACLARVCRHSLASCIHSSQQAAGACCSLATEHARG